MLAATCSPKVRTASATSSSSLARAARMAGSGPRPPVTVSSSTSDRQMPLTRIAECSRLVRPSRSSSEGSPTSRRRGFRRRLSSAWPTASLASRMSPSCARASSSRS